MCPCVSASVCVSVRCACVTVCLSTDLLNKMQLRAQMLEGCGKGFPWWSSGYDSAPSAGDPGSISGQGTRSRMLHLLTQPNK